MPAKSMLLFIPVVFGLSGCLENNTQRGVVGAAGGAVIADATGGSPITWAVVGGAAGYFCHDLNVPGCQNN
jgi:osmotically inducible lipoprotein OsmB